MILVLNEWVFHDLLFENDDPAFQETAQFLVDFAESEDVLVIPAEERWKRKAFQLMTMSDTRRRVVSRLLRSLMLDADRAIQIQPEEDPPVSRELLDRLPCEDVYLVLAYVSAGADLLITTDRGLFCAIGEHDDINCRMRDDFLPWYAAPGREM
jgi:hypothetical protein